MLAPENKASIIIDIIKDYDISRGAQSFLQEVTGNFAFNLDIKYEGVTTGGAFDGEVSILGSSDLETDESFYKEFQTTNTKVIDAAKGKQVIENSYLTSRWLLIKFTPKALTGGKLSITLVLNRTL
jgi:hypothetical protein